MNNKKPTSIPYHPKKHLASEHNVVPRLEGIVKNKGIKSLRKPKKYAVKNLSVTL